jgi:hypothetical protein
MEREMKRADISIGETMKQTVRPRRFAWMVSLLTLLLFLGGYISSAKPQAERSSPASRDPIDVGMVGLLSAPQKYQGNFIRTIGFVCIEFEGNALYLHEEDYRYGLSKNSFALRLSDSQRKQFKTMSLKYVLVEGTVDADGLERDEWGGAIGNITRFEVWPVDREPARHQ